MTDKLLQNLNEPQKEAVEYLGGPLLVLAGAGSGKTRVLTYKLAYLLQQKFAAPWEVLAVTFTNKAAKEMRNRVESLLKISTTGMWIGTFHSVCARILRKEAPHLGYTGDFTIYDMDDQLRQVQQALAALDISKDVLQPRKVLYKISRYKNKMISPAIARQKAGDFYEQKIADVFAEYEAKLKKNNAFDFDDLLLKPLELFTADKEILSYYQDKFKYILVDEYQDTNKAQYHFVKLLSEKHKNIAVVGDEDQSIYRWRGADIGNILSFEKDFKGCKIVRLEQNYRSTKTILGAANSVVAHNQQRLGKKLWSEKDSGEKIKIIPAQSEIHEAGQIARIIRGLLEKDNLSFNDVAILYRTNAQSRAIEDQLRRNNIPYQIVGGIKFYERKEIKDVLAYLRVIVNPADSIGLRRIINFPARGIGATTLQKIEEFARQKQLTLFEALSRVREIEDIRLGTSNRIGNFLKKIEYCRELAPQLTAFDLTSRILDDFGIRALYRQEETPENETRLENINELLNSIAIFSENHTSEENGVAAYLQEISLFTDVDRWDPDQPNVTLMTLHSAKGLEFPLVIIAGMEDGLFPLTRSLENDDDLEEERRLFYVGLTRAKRNLVLSWSQQRHRFHSQNAGMSFRNMPSRFIREIPDEFKDERGANGRSTAGYEPRNTASKFKKGKNQQTLLNYQETDDYKIGQWMQHESFGRGQILMVEKSNLGTKLTIAFGKNRIKKLIAEYANLEPV